MKTRIATILSLTGVLVAGSAAALVNTQVLASHNDAGGGESVTTVTNDPLTTAATARALANSLPTTTLAPTLTQAIYQIGDSGLVTLDTAGDVLTIVSAAPSPGWEVVGSESKDPLDIEVVFQSGTTRVEFKANLLFGIVSTSVESQNVAITGEDSSATDDGKSSGPGVTTQQPTNTTVASHSEDEPEHESEHESEPSDD